jgi:hypothetical protein
MKPVCRIAALLLLVMPVAVSAEGLGEAVPTLAPTVATDTETLRAAFVLNPETAWTLMTASERMALQTAFGNVAAARSVEIAWFMRGASTAVGNNGMSGLYNPLADAWLLMVWARVGGVPRVVQAALVPAERLGPGEGFTAREGDVGAALAAARTDRLAQFEDLTTNATAGAILSALAPTRIADRTIVIDRAARWLATLAGWQQAPGQPEAWARLRAEMLRGRKRGHELALLPKVARETMTPVGVVTHGGGEAVLMMSPLSPALVAISAAASGPVILADLGGAPR